jgi:UDP-N-acetyl-D-glucosamine dehydrogenase
MHKGMVIVLESTTYPGTTREVLLSKLGAECGLIIGEDWFLAFSPERVDPGREDFTTINTPKVMGGITPACGDVAATWYEGAIQTIHRVSSAETAELAKLLENTFRMINIGLVNELAIMCERLGVDVWEVIDAAATKPFGFMKFTPGPGLGGHCIPIDPLYLSWKMKSFQYNARFIELASEINTNMPRYVVSRVMEALNERGKPLKGSKILVLGAAYKPDVDDIRESPALDVIGLLQKKGATVQYHDPYIPHIHHEIDGWSMDRVKDEMQAAREADSVVIITNHKVYDYQAIVESAAFVFDSRNATRHVAKGLEKVVRL